MGVTPTRGVVLQTSARSPTLWRHFCHGHLQGHRHVAADRFKAKEQLGLLHRTLARPKRVHVQLTPVRSFRLSDGLGLGAPLSAQHGHPFQTDCTLKRAHCPIHQRNRRRSPTLNDPRGNHHLLTISLGKTSSKSAQDNAAFVTWTSWRAGENTFGTACCTGAAS